MQQDLGFEELSALVEYMYKGEVTVQQGQLPALIKAAEALQIRGLADDSPPSKSPEREKRPAPPPQVPAQSSPQKRQRVVENNDESTRTEPEKVPSEDPQPHPSNQDLEISENVPNLPNIPAGLSLSKSSDPPQEPAPQSDIKPLVKNEPAVDVVDIDDDDEEYVDNSMYMSQEGYAQDDGSGEYMQGGEESYMEEPSGADSKSIISLLFLVLLLLFSHASVSSEK